MTKRRYTDTQRSDALAALAANNGNVTRTARQLAIPAKTIENWAKGQLHPEVAEISVEKRRPLADRLEAVSHLLLDELSRPEKLSAANVQQIAVALGIGIDKARLLREQPTAITESQSTCPPADEVNKKWDVICEIASRIKARKEAMQQIDNGANYESRTNVTSATAS
jgi:hypothetical protein